MVIASDCRLGVPRGDSEMWFGDGASGLLIGNEGVIASIEESYSVYNEIFDVWRTEDDAGVRSWEDRFAIGHGYAKSMEAAVSGLMKKQGLTPKDFTKAVLYGPDIRSHAALVRSLGFDLKTQVQDPLLTNVGNTGVASPLMILVCALEEAEAGDMILLAGYGGGADALSIRVTEEIGNFKKKGGLKSLLDSRKAFVNYEKYVYWRRLLSTEPVSPPPSPPEQHPPSAVALLREQKGILALHGAKCQCCGTPQYPPGRVCVICQAVDQFDEYSFVGRRGTVFTFSIDYASPTFEQPTVVATVDFDGGGRMFCDMIDCEPSEVKIGMPVEMVFRKLYQEEGINNYFWKAKPLR